MAQRTGRAFIYIDGALQETMKGAMLDDAAGIARDAVIGSQVYGSYDEARAPKLTCSFAHGPDLSLQALADITDSSIMFQCDSGPIFVMEGAFFCNGKLDVDGHKVDCEFQALHCEEQLPQ
jgi:hypothetical protein